MRSSVIQCEYFLHDFETLQGVLQQNKRKFDYDPAGRSEEETLLKEFQTSLEKLTPLLSQLQATDELIDEIVFALYGLDENEIALVKGEGETGEAATV